MEKNSTNSITYDRERMLDYKIFSAGFSYPDDSFFKYFPNLSNQREKIIAEYDLLFRNKGLWLYTTEYTSKGTFQAAQHLCDIAGFYKAFGLNVDKDRPDSLGTEFEFMHFLIFKQIYAGEKKIKCYQEKVSLCLDVQGKFFSEYLYPGAKAIAEKILFQNGKSVYGDIAREMLVFLEEENQFFAKLSSPAQKVL